MFIYKPSNLFTSQITDLEIMILYKPTQHSLCNVVCNVNNNEKYREDILHILQK